MFYGVRRLDAAFLFVVALSKLSACAFAFFPCLCRARSELPREAALRPAPAFALPVFYLVWMPARRSHDCNTAFMPLVHDVPPAFTS